MHAFAFCCKLFYFNGKQKRWSHSPPLFPDVDVRISRLTAWMTRAVVFPSDRALVRLQRVPTNAEGESFGLLPLSARCFHALALASRMLSQLHFVHRELFCFPALLHFAQSTNNCGQLPMIRASLQIKAKCSAGIRAALVTSAGRPGLVPSSLLAHVRGRRGGCRPLWCLVQQLRSSPALSQAAHRGVPHGRW